VRRLDEALQEARLRRAVARIGHGCRVLDIGCHQGELSTSLAGRHCSYVGIDPDVRVPTATLIRGHFPDDVPPEFAGTKFDHLVALAVLEHLPETELRTFFQRAVELLVPGGSLIATVPSPATDHVLAVLHRLRLIDGMDLEAHDGLSISDLCEAADSSGLQLTEHRRFQLGFNNVLVWTLPFHA
jgi:cyclopropane fatty-acyl-phospholipid synthase-like methyltransferase